MCAAGWYVGQLSVLQLVHLLDQGLRAGGENVVTTVRSY